MFKNNVLIKTDFVKELYKSKNHHAFLIQQSKTFPDYEIHIDIKLAKRIDKEA